MRGEKTPLRRLSSEKALPVGGIGEGFYLSPFWRIKRENMKDILKKGRTYSAPLLFLAFFLFLPGCGSGAVENALDGEYHVVEVVDGDTLKIAGGRKVRYIGIDAPETMKRTGTGWVFQPEAYGMASKDRNTELVEGRRVFLEFDEEKKDRYDRWLAYIHSDGVMVNLELVREGLATVYTFPPNIKYYEELIRAQDHARAGRKGLWSSIREIAPEEATENVGSFRSVKGTVSEVRFSRGRIALHIGRGKRNHLKAVIFARNIPLFSTEGIDPIGHYRGRYVEVIGKIEDSGGPEIMIDNPSQIKVLE
jgi:micrococcal nuclease